MKIEQNKDLINCSRQASKPHKSKAGLLSLMTASLTICFFSLTLNAVPVQSNNQITAQSEQLLNELHEQIKLTAAVIAQIEKKAGNVDDNLQLRVESPASFTPYLGLVLDLNSDVTAYTVVSVAPGSLADELDMAPGDLITAINSVEVLSEDKISAFSQLEQSSPGDTVSFRLNKNGDVSEKRAVMRGRLTPAVKLEIGSNVPVVKQAPNTGADVVQPANEVCGIVSTFFTPPATKRLYNASIQKVEGEDGTSQNYRSFPRDRRGIKLSPGEYTIYMHESIEDPSFKRRYRGPRGAKPITLTIEPNTRYHLGAKFNYLKANRERSGEYWDPVIWKETSDQECEL